MASRGSRIVIQLKMGAKNYPDADSFNTVAEVIGSKYPEQVKVMIKVNAGVSDQRGYYVDNRGAILVSLFWSFPSPSVWYHSNQYSGPVHVRSPLALSQPPGHVFCLPLTLWVMILADNGIPDLKEKNCGARNR
ncbi:hypothetical protein CB1_001652020 [Camelus ferus]|nr:hypothetical protein CB1_001652020 [Camelus ferus]